MEADLQTMTDNLLLSLGVKNPMRDRMKRVSLYVHVKGNIG